MKVSISWLKELVKIDRPLKDLVQEINMKTIGIKEVTDKFIELDMKGYNRADLLSLRGVAYETASLLNSEVKFKEEIDFAWNGRDIPEVDIKIEDEDACPFYALAKIEGLKVEPSAKSARQKLGDSGFRSINNVADVTNLVMIEYGQPLHSFDADTVEGERVIVRKTRPNETLETLDSKKRTLETGDLLITDPKKALGIAGVMGGKNSEVKNQTSAILLEAAIFEPKGLRRTSTRLGLQSEASKRFYHGLTKKRLLQALSTAIKQYEKLGGRLEAISIFDKFEDSDTEIKLRVEKANSLIGLDLPEEQIKGLLERLNFKVSEIKPRVFEVIRPYFRLDVSIEEDLIEEVARMHGYDKIPSKSLPGELPGVPDQKEFEFIDRLKKTLMHQGLSEVQTYSFYSERVLAGLGFTSDKLKFLVKLANPISKETTYMRMNLWPNLVEAAVFNNKTFSDVAIFEIGKTFHPEKDAPEEKNVLGLSLINGSDNPTLELLKIVNQVFEGLNMEIKFTISKPIAIAGKLFHPHRFISMVYRGKQTGGIAELHPQIADNFRSKNRIAVCEIDLEKII